MTPSSCLAAGLEREGFSVTCAATGAAALEAEQIDVVLPDLGLPNVDGFGMCRHLRNRSDVPIPVISARGEAVDRVVGLELGADDYVVKPFGFRGLIARIRAVTRRTNPTCHHFIRRGWPPGHRDAWHVGAGC